MVDVREAFNQPNSEYLITSTAWSSSLSAKCYTSDSLYAHAADCKLNSAAVVFFLLFLWILGSLSWKQNPSDQMIVFFWWWCQLISWYSSSCMQSANLGCSKSMRTRTLKSGWSACLSARFNDLSLSAFLTKLKTACYVSLEFKQINLAKEIDDFRGKKITKYRDFWCQITM